MDTKEKLHHHVAETIKFLETSGCTINIQRMEVVKRLTIELVTKAALQLKPVSQVRYAVT